MYHPFIYHPWPICAFSLVFPFSHGLPPFVHPPITPCNSPLLALLQPPIPIPITDMSHVITDCQQHQQKGGLFKHQNSADDDTFKHCRRSDTLHNWIWEGVMKGAYKDFNLSPYFFLAWKEKREKTKERENDMTSALYEKQGPSIHTHSTRTHAGTLYSTMLSASCSFAYHKDIAGFGNNGAWCCTTISCHETMKMG